MPWFYHPNLPREQTVEHPNSPGEGWIPVDESTPEQPAEPVSNEQATDPLDHEKEN